MAFNGRDLRPLWHALMDKVTDDAAGAGMGMDLSVISQLLGDKPTGLACNSEGHARLPALYRSPCASDSAAPARAGVCRGDGYRRQHADGISAGGFGYRAGDMLCRAGHAHAP